MSELRPETLCVHAGNEPDAATGAVAPPIHLATTFRHGADGTRVAGYEYQREGNPTNDRLCVAIAALEGAQRALTFSSGMAAISTLLESLPAPARIVMADDCYVGLQMYVREFLVPRGAAVTPVDTSDLAAVEAACGTGVDLLWLETPSNPLLRVSDIAALARIGHAHGALVACDNTFATPLLQRPLALGADIAMHSTTKYFGGHSDVLGGALAFAREGDLFRTVTRRLHLAGPTLAPFSAWLTLRGLRSLPARITMHCANARALAAFLTDHAAVERVNYPGLATHPGHALAASQMRDFGGMLSVQLRGGRAAALAAASKLRIFTNATSLGGCESLVEHRASVEGPQPRSPLNLLRVSVGLEHADDLIGDWAQALTGP